MKRLSNLWWDLRHPIVAFDRYFAVRYCHRENLVMVRREDAPLEYRMKVAP